MPLNDKTIRNVDQSLTVRRVRQSSLRKSFKIAFRRFLYSQASLEIAFARVSRICTCSSLLLYRSLGSRQFASPERHGTSRSCAHAPFPKSCRFSVLSKLRISSYCSTLIIFLYSIDLHFPWGCFMNCISCRFREPMNSFSYHHNNYTYLRSAFLHVFNINCQIALMLSIRANLQCWSFF